MAEEDVTITFGADLSEVRSQLNAFKADVERGRFGVPLAGGSAGPSIMLGGLASPAQIAGVVPQRSSLPAPHATVVTGPPGTDAVPQLSYDPAVGGGSPGVQRVTVQRAGPGIGAGTLTRAGYDPNGWKNLNPGGWSAVADGWQNLNLGGRSAVNAARAAAGPTSEKTEPDRPKPVRPKPWEAFDAASAWANDPLAARSATQRADRAAARARSSGVGATGTAPAGFDNIFRRPPGSQSVVGGGYVRHDDMAGGGPPASPPPPSGGRDEPDPLPRPASTRRPPAGNGGAPPPAGVSGGGLGGGPPNGGFFGNFMAGLNGSGMTGPGVGGQFGAMASLVSGPMGLYFTGMQAAGNIQAFREASFQPNTARTYSQYLRSRTAADFAFDTVIPGSSLASLVAPASIDPMTRRFMGEATAEAYDLRRETNAEWTRTGAEESIRRWSAHGFKTGGEYGRTLAGRRATLQARFTVEGSAIDSEITELTRVNDALKEAADKRLVSRGMDKAERKTYDARQERITSLVDRRKNVSAQEQFEIGALDRNEAYRNWRNEYATGSEREVARETYDRRPNVGRAIGMYNQGVLEAVEARRTGSPKVAQNILERTRYELLGFQRQLTESGTATAVENPLAIDLGGEGSTGLNSIREGDDIPAAIGRLEELARGIQQKLDDINTSLN